MVHYCFELEHLFGFFLFIYFHLKCCKILKYYYCMLQKSVPVIYQVEDIPIELGFSKSYLLTVIIPP